MVAAHAVDTTAGRRGGRAKVEVGSGGAVLTGRGAEDKLSGRDGAAADVAADEVGVGSLEAGGRGDVASENGAGETGSEALDLGFEAREHVFGAAVRHVAVGPGDVLAGGRAGGIEEGGLGEQDEGTRGGAAGGHGGLGGGDLLEGAAEVNGGGKGAVGRGPGDGSGEGVVDLEDSGAVVEGGELAAVGGDEGGFAGGEVEKLARGDVGEDEVGAGEIGEAVDGRAGVDASAVCGKAGGECIGE